MRRLQQLALTMTTAALALGTSACTDAGSNLLILGNRSASGSCTFDTNIESGGTAAGLFDVQSPLLYVFAPVIQNAAPGDQQNVNADVVLLQGFDVEYSYLGGFLDAVPDAQRAILDANDKTTVLRSASVQPGGGLVTVVVDLFNESILNALADSAVLAGGARAIVEVEVTAFGTIDGGTVVSTPFRYPITLCDGCYTVNQGICSDEFALGGGYPCGSFQDSQLLCCENADGSLDCAR